MYLCLNCCCICAMQSTCPLTTPGDVSLANALDKPQSIPHYRWSRQGAITFLSHGASKLCYIILSMHRVTPILPPWQHRVMQFQQRAALLDQPVDRATICVVWFVTFWKSISVVAQLALLEIVQRQHWACFFPQDVSTTLMFDVIWMGSNAADGIACHGQSSRLVALATVA